MTVPGQCAVCVQPGLKEMGEEVDGHIIYIMKTEPPLWMTDGKRAWEALHAYDVCHTRVRHRGKGGDRP